MRSLNSADEGLGVLTVDFADIFPWKELDKEAERIEPVDEDLAKAGLAPPPDFLLRSGSELFWGSGERGPIPGSFEALFPNLLTGTASATQNSSCPFARFVWRRRGDRRTRVDRISGRMTERDLLEGTEALHQWRGIFAVLLAMISAENPNAFQSFFRSYAQFIVGDSPEIPNALEEIARSFGCSANFGMRTSQLGWSSRH